MPTVSRIEEPNPKAEKRPPGRLGYLEGDFLEPRLADLVIQLV